MTENQKISLKHPILVLFHSMRNVLLFVRTKICSISSRDFIKRCSKQPTNSSLETIVQLSSKFAEISRRQWRALRRVARWSLKNVISMGGKKGEIEYRPDKGGCRTAVQLRVEVIYSDDLIKPGANSMDVSRATNELRSHLRAGLVGTSCTPFPPD